MTDTTPAVRIAPEDIKWLDDLLLDQMDESASRSEECGPHEHDSRIIRLRSFLAAAPVAPGEGELADAVMRVDRWANYAYTFADTIAVDSPLSTFTAGDLRLILSALRARSEPEAGAVEETVRCYHEAYQGSCAHCGVKIVNGRAVSPSDASATDGEELPEVALARYIETLRSDEGDTVTICCDNPEARSPDERLAIDCNGAWTDFNDRRFTGESVLQCLAKAVTARAALGEAQQ